jgi:2-amino-4-hydroxy-6-hydroxymethyldihydropteridine diphosphokinase
MLYKPKIEIIFEKNFMHKLFLLLGSNMGKRDEVLFHALRKIDRQVGKVVLQSAIYETAAWGFEAQNSFYNCVLCVITEKSADEVLDKVLSIEQQIGRVRDETKWKERIIDIDILFYDDAIIEQNNLSVPHPYLHQRKFTLIPLHAIAPNLQHPVLKKSVEQLLIRLRRYTRCEESL